MLCFAIALINGYLGVANEPFNIDRFIGSTIGLSLLSIPIWSCIGVLLANTGLFFYNMIKPNKREVLTVWHKASLGLIAGIVLKPLFGIIW